MLLGHGDGQRLWWGHGITKFIGNVNFLGFKFLWTQNFVDPNFLLNSHFSPKIIFNLKIFHTKILGPKTLRSGKFQGGKGIDPKK